jgi:hypothetical protein
MRTPAPAPAANGQTTIGPVLKRQPVKAAATSIRTLVPEQSAYHQALVQVLFYDGSPFRWSGIQVLDANHTRVLWLQLNDDGRTTIPSLVDGQTYYIAGAQDGYGYAPPEVELPQIAGDVTVLLYAGPASWFPQECDSEMVINHGAITQGALGTSFAHRDGSWFLNPAPSNSPCWKRWFAFATNANGDRAEAMQTVYFFPLATPTPTPYETPTPTPTPIPTPTPSETPTATPTPTPIPTPTAPPTPAPLPICYWNQFVGNPPVCRCLGTLHKNGRCR